MILIRFVIGMAPVGMMVLGATAVSSQTYPNKPIRMVTSEAGGGSDFAARIITQALLGALNQQVIVDNRPTGIIPGDIVARALPDGYTLLFAGGSFVIEPLMQKTPYDLARDFLSITLAAMSPNVLVVNPSLPIKSVKELIALAKARQGELNYATGSTGGASHLSAELFKVMAGVNIVRINYKGGGPATNSLIAGEVQVLFATPGAVASHIKSGRLKALAVTSAEPSPLFPGLSTVAASGLPGYEATTPYIIFAPTGTPATIINRLNQEIVRVLNQANVKQRFFDAGIETIGSSPEQARAYIKSQMAKWGKVIKDAGIRAE